MTLTPSSGATGIAVTASGSGLTSYVGARYLFFDQDLAAVVTVSSLGVYSSSFIVPAAASTGAHIVTLRETNSSSSTAIASATYTVGSGTTATALTLSSTSGLPGSVATASGTLLDYADLELHLFFDSTYKATVTLTTDGAFSVSLVVPSSATAGSHTVTLRTEPGYNSGTAVGTATYTVTAAATGSITVTPASGKIGDTLTLSGTGFTAYTGMIFTLDNATLTLVSSVPVSPNSAGTFSTTFKIPTTAAGSHTVRVTDTSGKTATATFTTTIPLTTTISPASGKGGDTVTITGGGYTAGRTVSMTFGGLPVAASTTVQTGGSFSLTFVVPQNTAKGTHTVLVSDGVYQDSLTFSSTVAAAISLDNTAATIGGQVTVNGTDFLASQPVTITLNGIQVGIVPQASANGDFSFVMTIPSLPVGSYKIEARDAVNTISTDITISATMSLDKITGAIGETVTVTGQGFSGNIQVGYDGVEVATATVTGGAFTASFKVPDGAAGEHPVVVTDGTNAMDATFTVESEPPPTPVAVSLDPEIKSKDLDGFDWADVTDASGVTYNLQVATDPDFDDIVLEKMDLPESMYQLREGDQLTALDKDAAYYWRVQAVDGADNVGDWSSPETIAFAGGFKVGPIGMWVGVGVGLVLMLMLGFWLGRRTAYY